MMIRRSVSMLLGVALLLGGAVSTPAAPDLEAFGFHAYESPAPAPAFSLPDVSGHTWNLADLRGKVVLIFFWATW
jgi:cytochrome oxidase Cu insertion factor (SCO1/SenC/PrrC family)